MINMLIEVCNDFDTDEYRIICYRMALVNDKSIGLRIIISRKMAFTYRSNLSSLGILATKPNYFPKR